MAYYYVTNVYDVYKKVGARRVKLIYSANAIKKMIALANEITKKQAGTASWITIPMIRRTFPQLITQELFQVQPMSAPVGLSFALKYQYDKPFELEASRNE